MPETWPDEGGEKISVAEIAALILNGPEINGVTFLGGEPFAQARSLAVLGMLIKKAGLSVVTFTGYLLEEIQKSPLESWHDLVSVSDILIDGPYCGELADYSRPWVGSSNKRFHFLSSRYNDLKSEIMNTPNRLEIRLTSDGKFLINGMASLEVIDELFNTSYLKRNIKY